MLTVRQLFVVCIGFAFTALTICAIYVNSIGMHSRYQMYTRKELTEHSSYATANGHRPTEKLRVAEAFVASNLSSIKSNATEHVLVRPLVTEKVQEQGNKNVTVETSSSNRTSVSHDANNGSSGRTFARNPVPPVLVDGVHSMNGTPDPLYTHHGYISVLDHKTKLNLHCMQCAVVSSSGQLLHSRVGYLIDEADCIFRMNDAPVPSYEEDVGSRTTVRVVGHAATPNLRNRRKYLLQESSSRYVIGWGPAKPMQTNGRGYAYKYLKDLAKQFKEVDFFYLTQEQMAKADQIFEEETGKPRNLANKNVPYHYYNQFGVKECSYYRAHEKGKKGFHRFMTEKSIFARWALEQPPIYFHVPDWNPK
ncbi:alpha-N-acetylgalactosaminide alpha-2,6-sialyltransferase 3-like isoform X2 [Acanthaster planci]|uniref:Alpha-N-acetylgalactosaminide alpha-2,6-sialyltransferase 3-like isoform X2 n=1 Tax=Acanthaster planci TaxID=133434 RepID=A0A8B7Z5Z6_ACAPL|nr:alpha-N-acetylgalactosaminide alpha-2,6-sialyltransferase 3-like isoform X2 [Acanthaster planci]